MERTGSHSDVPRDRPPENGAPRHGATPDGAPGASSPADGTPVPESRPIRRLNARAWGISFGLLLGGGLFVATNVLVLKGGPNVGQHLGLLSVFLPGYSVTLLGSVVGFVYLFVIGYGIGRILGGVYNWLVGGPR